MIEPVYFFCPALVQWLKEGAAQSLRNGGPLVMVEYACIGGNFLMTVALTLTVNLIRRVSE